MKRITGLMAVAVLGLGFAPASWAIAVNGTDVGSVDTLLGTAQGLNSGGEELAFIQGILGPGAQIGNQVEEVDYSATDTLGVFAFVLNPVVDYFMLKNATWHALFANVPNMGWAVFGPGLPAGMNIGKLEEGRYAISHVRLINPTEPPPEVPEPSTLALLGLGLGGLALLRRRRTS